MNYALVEDKIVTNVIWLYSGDAHKFPNAVQMNGVPAGIGDAYVDGAFYRNGERVLSEVEQARKEAEEATAEAKSAQSAYEEGVQNA